MDEYIKKEAAIRALLNDSPEQVRYSRDDAADCIRYMDAADVAPARHGRWEKESSLKPKCSVCGEYHLYAWSDHRNCNYCPNCGARMDLHEGEANDT